MISLWWFDVMSYLKESDIWSLHPFSLQGEATVAEIWTSLEERTEGLQRHRMESWSLLSSERYGLPEEQAKKVEHGRKAETWCLG